MNQKLSRMLLGLFKNSLLKDISGSALLKVCYLTLQMIASIMLARSLGVAEFGFYSLVMACFHLLLVLVGLGFPASLVRSISQSTAAKTGISARRLLRVAQWAVLTTALLAMCFWAISGALLQPSHLFAILLLMIALSQADIAGAAIRGLGHVVEGQFPQQILRPALFLLLLFSVGIFSTELTPTLAFSFHAAAAVTAAIYAIFSVNRKLARLIEKGESAPAKQIIYSSLPFLLLASIHALNYQIGLIVVGLLLPATDVGLYRVAVQVVDGLGIVLFAFSMALGPRISRLQSLNDYFKLRRLLLCVHVAATSIMLIVTGIVVVFSESIVVLLFGPEYAPAATPLIVLAFGKVLYASVAFCGLGLSMLGQPGRSTVALSIGLALNIGLAFWLIPSHGLFGAAMATILAAFVGNLLAATFLIKIVWRKD